MLDASQLVQVAGFDSLAETVKATQEDAARQQLLTAGCLHGVAKHFRHTVRPSWAGGLLPLRIRDP